MSAMKAGPGRFTEQLTALENKEGHLCVWYHLYIMIPLRAVKLRTTKWQT